MQRPRAIEGARPLVVPQGKSAQGEIMEEVKSIEDFPDLETDRLWLRRLSLEDVGFVFQHFGDPAVSRFLLDEPPMTRVEEAEELIRFYQNPDGKAYNRWGLVHKEQVSLVGTCGYHRWSRQHRRAEVGYDLAPDYWGQGLMREALTSIFRHGFEEMGLNRIEAIVHPENARSLSLLQRLGFQREGLLRGHLYQGGRFHDEFILSLLKGEWMANAARQGGEQ